MFDNGDFKSGWFMFMLAAIVVVFVTAQSVFFISKSWKHAKELGIEKTKLKNTVVSSILFTIAPAISILATVLVLSKALGIVLPWIRLTVIGNLAYETTAAQTAVEAMGASLTGSITDPQQFSTIAWAMTIGCIAPLLMLPFVCKKLQKKIGSTVAKNEKSAKMGDAISAAAFIGIISAFVAREINGRTTTKETFYDAAGNILLDANGEAAKITTITGSAGAVSILTLIFAMLFVVLITLAVKKFKWEKFEPFIMPVAMFAAMGMAIVLTKYLPDSISSWTWYEIGEVIENTAVAVQK